MNISFEECMEKLSRWESLSPRPRLIITLKFAGVAIASFGSVLKVTDSELTLGFEGSESGRVVISLASVEFDIVPTILPPRVPPVSERVVLSLPGGVCKIDEAPKDCAPEILLDRIQ